MRTTRCGTGGRLAISSGVYCVTASWPRECQIECSATRPSIWSLVFVRQRIVGRAQVGELGLAALVGHDMGVEHRQRARHGAERGVGVPQPVGQPVEPALAVGLQHLAVAVEVGDVGDLVPKPGDA